MNFAIPSTLQHEHEALHERLRQATHANGEVGEAARQLARLMLPHMVKEERFALPPLALLARLARGEWSDEMAEVLTLTEQLQAELPSMIDEHRVIVAALADLRHAAQRTGRTEIVALAEAVVEHARTDEEVNYPAAVLVGRLVRQQLDRRAAAA